MSPAGRLPPGFEAQVPPRWYIALGLVETRWVRQAQSLRAGSEGRQS